VEQAKRVFSLF
jgi:metallo-beta-lactamase family protein